MAKVRNHNEWFRSVSLGGRKSCPCCGDKLQKGEFIWSWGEYVYAKWRTVKHFCKSCFAAEVQAPLQNHAGPCGCVITIVAYQGERLPAWLTLTPECPVQKEAA